MTRAEQFTTVLADSNLVQHNQWRKAEWAKPIKLTVLCLTLWGLVAVVEAVLKHGGM